MSYSTLKSVMEITAPVAEALERSAPVVALESTLIAHGLPWPENLETARAAEAAIREVKAMPATIAVIDGIARIGLSAEELARLARAAESPTFRRSVCKAVRRDLPAVIAQRRTAATTVSATMFLAHQVGIRVFATGGIGGVHRDAAITFDISSDLTELARTPVCVVCAGAKSILDLPATLEALETLGVPVIGYQTDEFPAFCVKSSGLPLEARVETPAEAAAILRLHWAMGGAGALLVQQPPAESALDAGEFANAFHQAQAEAARMSIRGDAVTPFLLCRMAELTNGRTVQANRDLVIANALLAGKLAACVAAPDT